MCSDQSISARASVTVEDLCEKANVDEANTLLIEGRRGLADTSRGILVAGQAYNKLKPMFKKGSWLPWLTEECKRTGHSIRSIQQYMKAARDAADVNEKTRVFAKASDPQAVAIKEACERAEQNVADAISANDLSLDPAEPTTKKPPRKSPPLLDGLFRLPLNLSGDEKAASKKLLESQNWQGAQKYVTAVWHRVLVQYGYLVAPNDQATTEPRKTSGSVPGYVAADTAATPITPTEAGNAAHPSA